jgi:hypothetical protein
MLKPYSKIWIAAALCFFLSVGPVGAASEPPAVGGKLPEIKLAAPQSTRRSQRLFKFIFSVFSASSAVNY